MKIKNLQTLDLPSGLYLVSTPIGNLRDISLRALDVLKESDLLVCEDTRVTGKLLKAYDIQKKMISYNDHSTDRQRGQILNILTQNGSVALVSDAGTPLISDPGYKLVQDCIDLGLPVTTIPGANASLSALQLSGLPSDKFSFIGFLPSKKEARKKQLKEWAHIPGTLIMFESGPRLAASLADMHTVLGDRPAAVVREITKLYEEARRGSLHELLTMYTEESAPKGELVVLVGRGPDIVMDDDALEKQLRLALQSMSVKDAAAFVAESSGQPKKKLYEMALMLQNK